MVFAYRLSQNAAAEDRIVAMGYAVDPGDRGRSRSATVEAGVFPKRAFRAVLVEQKLAFEHNFRMRRDVEVYCLPFHHLKRPTPQCPRHFPLAEPRGNRSDGYQHASGLG